MLSCPTPPFLSSKPTPEDCTRLASRRFFLQKRPAFVIILFHLDPVRCVSRPSRGRQVHTGEGARACARRPGAAALYQICAGSLSAIRCDASCDPFADPRNGRVHGVAGGNREEARAQESFRGLHASCGGQDARTPGDDGQGFRCKPSSRSGAAALVVWLPRLELAPRVEA